MQERPRTRFVPISNAAAPVEGFVTLDDGRYYCLPNCHRQPAFFMNIASASDLWLFLASNGGLTAGRCDAERALFPYITVDKVYDSAGLTGPVTKIFVQQDDQEILWEPFAPHVPHSEVIARHLYKSVEGDRVWFEEVHSGLGLRFRQGWSTADEHGFIRRCSITNLSNEPISLRVIDGLRNLLPPGIGTRLQTGSSCLADAYKTAEVVPGTTLAVYALNAAIIDRAIPLESLHATAVWSEGLPGASVLLSDNHFARFAAGASLAPDTRLRGMRTSYAITSAFTLAPKTTQDWLMVADIGLTQADVAARHRTLVDGDLAARVLTNAEAATARLRAIVAAGDGLQASRQENVTVHHFANVLFNSMRGGIFADGYKFPRTDFAAFIHTHDHALAERHADFLAALPESFSRADLLARVRPLADASLTRLATEYLPLTFSRRHGDPSRPWNRFRIRVRDEHGQRVLAHEGNWRDIFQNWEALCLSFPEYYDAIVAKFLNASTADGFNPYRISQAGVDWEVPDHEDPWASIGYWGDHQVVYLLKLLEWSARFHPGRLDATLRQPLYSYARVPYQIANYEAMRRDPRATIEFDDAAHRAILKQVAQTGTDARLLHAPDGKILHASLTEKLIVLALARLTNFIPGGGIWLNTQRPEWNDANNALVGNGLSIVTLAYFRRLLRHWQVALLPALGSSPVPVASTAVALANRVRAALEAYRAALQQPQFSDTERRAIVDALATAGSDYRDHIYRQGPGDVAAMPVEDIASLVEIALAYVDHTLRGNRRDDGHYHAYNLLEFTENPAALRIHHLPPMLEGQVAVLSSGLLSPAETVDLLTALRKGPLYRADQHSYVLYPDRVVPGFLEKNIVPSSAVETCPLLRDLLAAGDSRLIVRDAAGTHRFQADLVNGDALADRLAQIATEPSRTSSVRAHAVRVHEIYEQVFHHRAFTGRSGSMFGYEGLGCIYWHMVAKLLLAVQENLLAAQTARAPETERLAEIYYDVRAGLGFNKTAAAYGGFPTDPYSHTPGHSGAQQPGMTGQVKEEILTRFGELGVIVANGTVTFAPTFLQADEFTTEPTEWSYNKSDGAVAMLPLPAGSVAFTFCGVPVIYQRKPGPARIRMLPTSGKPARVISGNRLDPDTSGKLFARTGDFDLIVVDLGEDFQPLTRPHANNPGLS